MNDPEHTKAYKPEQPAMPDETVDDVGSQAEHPSEDVLLQLAAGRLDTAKAAGVRGHLTACAECTQRLGQLGGSIVSLIDELGSTQSPHGRPNTAASPPDETVAHPAPTVDTTSESTVPSFGDYQLISEIARGGMGVVYKARQKSLNRVVALKMIKSGEFANQEQVDRFYKEAEAAANLDHPGIVPVHEVGEVDGQHYFTMGFVDGDSLADRLRDGPLPPKEAARYAKSIAEAVAYAHSKGVIHRDLKPGNVLITKEGTLRITDFGLAKRIEEDSELTSTGQVLGTPSYMPPEQAEGKLSEIGPAADIYAVGATLYCMLVGRPPFQAANVIETLNLVLEAEPVSPRTVNINIPLDLETLCLKCLEKKPSSRYESTTEVVGELNRFLNGEPIHARPVGRFERTVRWCKRKPIHTTALALLIILSIGGPALWIQLLISNRNAAISKVDALLNASPATIPLLLSDLDDEFSTVRSRLEQLDARDLETGQRLRVSLALLPNDSKQLDKLKAQFTDCTYEELEVLLGRVRDHGGDSIVEELWTAYRSTEQTDEQRFRTGVALAALDSGSEQWSDDDFQLLVRSMLAVNTVYQPAVRRSLAPMANRLVDELKLAYESAEPGTLADESSANAIVDFVTQNVDLLSELSSFASPKQHSILFPVIEKQSETSESIFEKLIEITKLQPKADDDEPARIKLGKKRAGAAINLVRLKKPEKALEVLRVKEDPESLTQFVHGCKDRGITVEQLVDLLNRATAISERFGILLALGEFKLADIPEDIRTAWVDSVKRMYANDPSSGIHGASGWLLREWGLTEEAKAIDEREVPYSKDREWFTLKINLSGPLGFENYSYFTFVVFRSGEYQIGSPEYETARARAELAHTVEFSRDFAVLDREVTRGEYESFRDHLNVSQYSPSFDSAMVAPSWYDSVRFCRWLTTQRGLGETDQCYVDPSTVAESDVDPDPEADGMPRNWTIDLSKRGFRLLTETEWEVACRAGVVSRYGFGCDESHLVHYGWYQVNSGRQAHVGRETRPNLRGLFDMHGNPFEWVHDWLGSYPSDPERDPLGEKSGQFRVGRGGGWGDAAADCRAAYRFSNRPTYRAASGGFRLALVPFDEQSSQAK